MLPFEVCGKGALFGVGEGFMGDFGFVVFGVPKVVAVDIAVGEPEGAVVGVIGLLPRDVLLHGVVAGETGAGGADKGVKVREVVVGAVFGDEGVTIKDPEGGFGLFLPEFTEGGLNQKNGDQRE